MGCHLDEITQGCDEWRDCLLQWEGGGGGGGGGGRGGRRGGGLTSAMLCLTAAH